MLDFLRGMFVDDRSGSLKWGSIIGVAAGAFLLPSVLPFLGEMGIMGTLLGGVVGLLGGNLVGKMFSGGESTGAAVSQVATIPHGAAVSQVATISRQVDASDVERRPAATPPMPDRDTPRVR